MYTSSPLFGAREIDTVTGHLGGALKELREHTKSQVRSDYPTKAFAPSSLTYDFCPRAWVILQVHPEAGTARADSIDFGSARTMLSSRYGSEWVHEAYADAGMLWGRYRHRGGCTTHVGFKPDGDGWEYGKLPVADPVLRITGVLNGYLKVGTTKCALWVKAVGSYGYAEIADGDIPGRHLLQAAIYMHCLAETENQHNASAGGAYASPGEALFAVRPFEHMILLYINRDDFRVRLICLNRDDHTTKQLMDEHVRPGIQAALGALQRHVVPACTCGGKNILCRSSRLASESARYISGDAQEIAIDDQVVHEEWGEGVVIDRRTVGQSRVITVQFRNGARTIKLPDDRLVKVALN